MVTALCIRGRTRTAEQIQESNPRSYRAIDKSHGSRGMAGVTEAVVRREYRLVLRLHPKFRCCLAARLSPAQVSVCRFQNTHLDSKAGAP